MQIVYLLLTGLCAGVLSGMFGIGGGVVIVPALVLLFGFPQQTATATSLVVFLMPVGILGVIQYYNAGKIDMDQIRVGLIIAAGLVVGSFFGSKLALTLPVDVLRKAFAVLLLLIAAKLFFDK